MSNVFFQARLDTGVCQWGEEIMITPQNLIRTSNAIAVNLTDGEKPYRGGSTAIGYTDGIQ
ncbi:MAG: hypothetical protein IT315_11945 [Anaerolineales bacterium]|nr:hypothetical protein [Anaerolineales bacterium]